MTVLYFLHDPRDFRESFSHRIETLIPPLTNTRKKLRNKGKKKQTNKQKRGKILFSAHARTSDAKPNSDHMHVCNSLLYQECYLSVQLFH